MRKTACFTGLLLLFVAQSSLAAPIIKISEPVWNVGIVVSGGSYEKTVQVENVGDAPLVIDRVEECCGFTGVIPAGLRLAPGEQAAFQLSLAPFKMVGPLHAEIFLVSNDPVRPRASIVATGEVKPAIGALGEVAKQEVALGRISLRDRVPFSVRLRNVGNAPLEVRHIDKTDAVVEKGGRPVIVPGSEGDLQFEFVPRQSGVVDERISIETNDALERHHQVRIHGHILPEYVAEQAISIYPPGGVVSYDVMAKAYRMEVTVSNRGPVQIEVPLLESSIQGARIDLPRVVAPGEMAKGSVTFAGGPAAAPNSGYIYLQLAIPVELR